MTKTERVMSVIAIVSVFALFLMVPGKNSAQAAASATREPVVGTVVAKMGKCTIHAAQIQVPPSATPSRVLVVEGYSCSLTILP